MFVEKIKVRGSLGGVSPIGVLCRVLEMALLSRRFLYKARRRQGPNQVVRWDGGGNGAEVLGWECAWDT